MVEIGGEKMKIERNNRKVNYVMALEKGDVFLYDSSYYVVGEFNIKDDCRDCYNLSKNYVLKMRYNPVVEYWHSDEIILKLSDGEC